MPMDYDDNDTSHHNLQLAGQGKARSSSALRPYDFPKFDFDDSLQGHLRFDSLVETEVFLGIQSQEDNQWIEDFSRGSNGMEFNSTPADSCSISRRNNVWSEATSSESVEMLLKSVGQEEMMPGASIRQESDATADQGTLSKLVESSNNKLKERNGAHGAKSDTTSPQDEVLQNYLASSRHMKEQLEDSLAAVAKDESLSGNSSNLHLNPLCGNGGTLIDEGKNSYLAESTSEILEESKKKTTGVGDDLSFPSITDHVDPAFGMLSASEACQQVNSSVSHESYIDDGQDKRVSSKTELEDATVLQGKTGVTSIYSAGSSLGLVQDSGKESQEANLDYVRDSVDNLVKGEFELKSSEGDDFNTSFTTSFQNVTPENALSVSNDMDKPFDKCQSGSSMDVIAHHLAEISSLSLGHCTSPNQLTDPIVQCPHKRDSDNMEDKSASLSNRKSVSEMSLLSMEVNEDSTAMGESIGKAVISSAADHEHSENSEGCLKDTIAVGEDMNIPMQVIQDNLDRRRTDISVSEKNMYITTVADKEVPGDLEIMDSKNIGTPKNDHKTQSLEVREGLDVDTAINNLMPQTSGKSESVKVSTPISIKASTASAGHHEVGETEPAAIELHPDNHQEEVGMIDANLRTEVDNASKVGGSVVDDTVRIINSEISAISQHPVEKIDDICCTVSSSKEALGSLSSDCKKSSLKENADLANGGETVAKEEEKASGQTSDIDKASCGSPTIISSSEPSQLENNDQGEGRGYQITDEVKGIQSTSEALKRMDSLGEDSGFTFKVNALPETTDREPGKNWSPFPDVEKSKVLEETAPSGKGKTERSSSHKTPRKNARMSDGETGPGTSKGTSERKGRRGSAKGTAKENVKKGNQLKSPIQENASLKVEKVSNSLLDPPSTTSHAQFGQMQQHYGNVEATNIKPFGGVAVYTSNLPDLNASAMSSSSTASSSPTFQQPFSDLQQVQLRAQIFVYGSLIQGHVPDESFMVSAYGQYEGGRNFWERTWRAAAERVENQKSSSTAAETPCSLSGSRASDAVKQGSHSSKVPATLLSRANIKETSAAVSSPIIPVSSPLWNISTPSRGSLTLNPLLKGPIVDFQQALSPVHPYQTPIRNYISHTSWSSQTGFPGPWLVSPQTSSFSANVQFHPATMTETVKLTPVKDTSAMFTSIGKQTTSSQAVYAVSPSPALGGVPPLHDQKSIASAVQHSVDAKPRKRKKVPASDPGQVIVVSEPQTGSKVVLNVASAPIIPVGAVTPLVSDAVIGKPTADASTVSSIELPMKTDVDMVKGVACSEETLSKVAEAKSQAEDAAALANSAVTHCEDLWGQLAKQMDSGLTSETEAKIASSAVAIAAAVSVAKAAAAAAKIAFNAALQAKSMADEAFHSSKNRGIIPSSGKSSNDMHDAGNATSTSFLKSNSVTNQSSSILVAAKEAAKRRVEAASAASRQAENLDAIVKAAELAAAAVSQAGKIVAMGEPLPLNDLIEAGPEGYWKLSQVRDWNIDQSGAVNADKTGAMPAGILPVDSVERGEPEIVGKDDIHSTEGPDGLSNALSSVGVVCSKHTDDKDLRIGIDHEASDMSKSGRGASEIDTSPGTTKVKNDYDDMGAQTVDGIKEGSHIEVFNPRCAHKSAWYTANVLSVEKGRAYVCYNDLLSEKGSGNVQEWVSLESDGDKAPIIRTSHPSSALQYQQTRKRRRAALGDYVWCVGDRVDVWIDDCWWEGVVTEKNGKDETTLKVYLSAEGETETVRAWNLRASRSWIKGKWIECSSLKGQNTSGQSDTPQQKRQKLGSTVVSTKENEPNNLDSTLEKPELSEFLTLSTSERTFDIGKTTTIDDKKLAARRPLRTNQQKEGSRVVFGVPKPTGKKRKFMEVSKHFAANKNDKSNEAKDSVKFAKYLMPQGAPSRGWKVPSRNDSKDKRIVESRPRVLSTRKAQRNLPQRGNTRPKSAQNADIPLEDSVSLDENTSDKSVDHGSGAFVEGAEAPLSSLLPHSLNTASKKISSSNFRTDRLNRGRLGPSGVKLSKIEDKVYSGNTGKSTLDVSEPRRSNRQIQPTHRLLEGLQSSMVIPKMPAVPHDKIRRNLPARGK